MDRALDPTDACRPTPGAAMTSPSEDRLRRAVDELLTICWNEDIPLLDALQEALDDWRALAAAEFDRMVPYEPLPSGRSSLLTGSEGVASRLNEPAFESAAADAIVCWVNSNLE